MTNTDTGTYGAKAQSWKSANPRALLKSLIDENPDADYDALFRLMFNKIEGAKVGTIFETIFEYWFANNYRSIVHELTPIVLAENRKANAETVKVLTAKTKADVKRAIEKKAKRVLLNAIMPNGKMLRDTSFGECAYFGGWLALIGKAGKADQIVGEHLTEPQVAHILETA